MLVIRQSLVVCFLLAAGLYAHGASPQTFTRCLDRAKSVGSDPVSRDEARMECITKQKNRIDFPTCMKAAKGMEYSTNSENMKNLCLFELRKNPTARQCATTARSMEYGDNRDEMIWSCLKRMNLTISLKDCRTLANLMIFPYNISRATSYCNEEIRISR